MKLCIPQQAIIGSCSRLLPRSAEAQSVKRHFPKLFQKQKPTPFVFCPPSRSIHTTQRRYATLPTQGQHTGHYIPPAQDLDRNVTEEEKRDYDKKIAEDKGKAIRTPWQRDGSDQPPVSRNRSAGAMTKGKLLTTPTRLFKLVLPLTTRDDNSDSKNHEPLALLIHPQQPLSYLERLIQAELPLLTVGNKETIPTIHFWAVDSTKDDIPLGEEGSASEVEDAEHHSRRDRAAADDLEEQSREEDAALDKHEGPEDASHTHLRSKSDATAAELRGGPGEGGVESYSGLGHEATDAPEPTRDDFVRWSKSTEIGDFVRDAARGREFAVEIQGAPREIRVGVPSFGDRTYYLRMRLRKRAKQIVGMADIKRECDIAAERGAQRMAYAGFGGMATWLGVVYYLTFQTSLGWDTLEPITYLVGLSAIMVGYGWFLINKREASYRSAMNLTISRRQQALYEQHGFDLKKWEYIMEEANALRREIIAVAQEYDVDWDEKKDAQDDKVIEALKDHRHAKAEKEGRAKEKKGEDD